MEESTLYLITQVFIAIGTTVVCILAVWGDKIRSYIAGPRLRFELHNPRGDLALRRDGRRTIYYHVKIKNERHWAAARRVHILCNSISKKSTRWFFCAGAIDYSGTVNLGVPHIS